MQDSQGAPIIFRSLVSLYVAGQAGRAYVVTIVVTQKGSVIPVWVMASCAFHQWLVVKVTACAVVQRQVRLRLSADTVSVDVIHGLAAGGGYVFSVLEVSIKGATGLGSAYQSASVLDADRVIVSQIGTQVDHFPGNLRHLIELFPAVRTGASTPGKFKHVANDTPLISVCVFIMQQLYENTTSIA
jgi:hypothetical protein